MSDKELNWVNVMRALCMMGVYVWHSETFTSSSEMLTPFIAPFCMAAFFFVSGYLFFRKALRAEGNGFYLETLANIFFRLALPTILISILLYIPRTAFHGTGATFADFLICTVGGTTLWFTFALTLVQLLALLLLRIGLKNFWVLLFVGILLGLGRTQVDAPFNAFPWSYTSAMRFFVFFILGGCFLKAERLRIFAERRLQMLCFLVCLVAYLAFCHLISPTEPILNYARFLLVALLGTLAMLFLSRLSPYSRWLSFVGRRSMSFYVLCGAVPAFVGKAVTHFGVERGLLAAIVFLFSIVLASIISWVLWRWFPWLFDIRRWKGC